MGQTDGQSTAVREDIPYPGSKSMPQWGMAELPEAPRFQFAWRRIGAFIGPGLMMGGAAIGGGEWLSGPLVTARYGGGLLWLATMSILAQVLYNLEISRYTLYTGEPIFSGKFRTLPGPLFWVGLYLILDFGSVFPYLAASAAVPVAAVWLGEIPNPTAHPEQAVMLRWMGIGIFLLCFVPLIFGGKIFNSLKVVITFKIVTVMGFLTFLAIFYSHSHTWWDIGTGFFRFGEFPVSDTELDNVFVALWQGRSLPAMNLTMMGTLSAFIAISGQGGLSNTPISNYTRDQGWGMGGHVGAIPSLVGGQNIELSHVGSVFAVTGESLPRWRGWYRLVLRDQLLMWMPACFVGLALPSMLSMEFLKRGTVITDKWVAAGMTADAVRDRVGASLGQFCWYMTLFCGFLVLAPTMASTIDGIIRRWVDAFWTSSKHLRAMETHKIKHVYFTVLVIYGIFGVCMLSIGEPTTLLEVASLFYNFALGFSCWHVLVINTTLLPRELRPHWSIRVGLVIAGIFFWAVAIISTYATVDKLTRPKSASAAPAAAAAPASPGAASEAPASKPAASTARP